MRLHLHFQRPRSAPPKKPVQKKTAKAAQQNPPLESQLTLQQGLATLQGSLMLPTKVRRPRASPAGCQRCAIACTCCSATMTMRSCHPAHTRGCLKASHVKDPASACEQVLDDDAELEGPSPMETDSPLPTRRHVRQQQLFSDSDDDFAPAAPAKPPQDSKADVPGTIPTPQWSCIATVVTSSATRSSKLCPMFPQNITPGCRSAQQAGSQRGQCGQPCRKEESDLRACGALEGCRRAQGWCSCGGHERGAQ